MNPNATLGYTDGTYYYTPDNWVDETFSNRIRQEYNASVSASTEKLSYYSSFGYLQDSGIIQNSGFKRYTGRLKGDYKVSDWLKIGGILDILTPTASILQNKPQRILLVMRSLLPT